MCKINLLELGGTGFGWLEKNWRVQPLYLLLERACTGALRNPLSSRFVQQLRYNEDRKKNKHKVLFCFSGQAGNGCFSRMMTERWSRVWIRILFNLVLVHSNITAMSEFQRERHVCPSVCMLQRLLNEGWWHAAISWGIFISDTVSLCTKPKPRCRGGAAIRRVSVCMQPLWHQCCWHTPRAASALGKEQFRTDFRTALHLQAWSTWQRDTAA